MIIEPVNTIGQVGKSVMFHCTAVAIPNVMSITWHKNDALLLLTSASQYIIDEHNGDTAHSMLFISDLSMSDSQNVYKCIVSNSEGTIESSEGILTVNRKYGIIRQVMHLTLHYYIAEAVVILNPPISTIQKEGTQAIFSCIAIGHPPPSIVWTSPNGELPGNDTSIMINTFQQTQTSMISILVLSSLKYTNNGNHSCKATNLAHGVNNPLDVDIQTFVITVQSKYNNIA